MAQYTQHQAEYAAARAAFSGSGIARVECSRREVIGEESPEGSEFGALGLGSFREV